MTLYSNLVPVVEPFLLERHDEVEFHVDGEVFSFKVNRNYFYGANSSTPMRFFEAMGLNQEAKTRLAEEVYGYSPMDGLWPPYRTFLEASRFTLVLFKMINETPKDKGALFTNKSITRMGLLSVLKSISSDPFLISRMSSPFLDTGEIEGILMTLVMEGVLRYDGATYSLIPEMAPILKHLYAITKGETVSVVPENLSAGVLLKYIQDSPASVTNSEIMSTFGEEGVRITSGLSSQGLLRNWERGFYTNPDYRDTVQEMITEVS